jgi:cell division protein FtsN
VQVGTFDVAQNAQALALRVRALGYAVSVTPGPPYRVRVGGYVDRTTAEKLAANLHTSGFDALLTP